MASPNPKKNPLDTDKDGDPAETPADEEPEASVEYWNPAPAFRSFVAAAVPYTRPDHSQDSNTPGPDAHKMVYQTEGTTVPSAGPAITADPPTAHRPAPVSPAEYPGHDMQVPLMPDKLDQEQRDNNQGV